MPPPTGCSTNRLPISIIVTAFGFWRRGWHPYATTAKDAKKKNKKQWMMTYDVLLQINNDHSAIHPTFIHTIVKVQQLLAIFQALFTVII